MSSRRVAVIGTSSAHAGRSRGHEVPRARLDVDERRRRLIALGLELFSQRTYDEVSIDELAQAAGISKGLLYHYFPTKRDFYVATVREAANQLLARTNTDVTSPADSVENASRLQPLDRVRAGLDGFLDYVITHGPAYEGLLRSGIGADAEVARIIDETREAFCSRILAKASEAAANNPLLRVALRGWVGFVETATLAWVGARNGVSREALRDMLADTLFGVVQQVVAVRAAAR